jgi:hypothetical protein
MATLIVGSGQQYATVTAAIAAAKNGDTVEVLAGNYVNDFPATITQSLTLTGIGGVAHLSATVPVPNGKAILVIGNDVTSTNTVTLNNIELSGATCPSNNGAGIRYQGGTLTLNDCFIHDNQEGILGGTDSTVGMISMNNTEFARNGFGDGFTHNIYVQAASLTCNAVYSHDSDVGHLLKSRCGKTVVQNSRFQDQAGNGSYCLDFPNGGIVSVTGTVIEKGVNATNHTCMIAYGEEGSILASSSLTIDQNTFINDCPQLQEAVWNVAPSVNASITTNSEWAVNTMLAGTGLVTGTTSLTAEPPLVTSSPWINAPTVASVLAAAAALNTELVTIKAAIGKAEGMLANLVTSIYQL